MTQPTGTSPRLPAARASAKAISMKEGIYRQDRLDPAIHVFVRCGV
jgi:hypothetical protein